MWIQICFIIGSTILSFGLSWPLGDAIRLRPDYCTSYHAIFYFCALDESQPGMTLNLLYPTSSHLISETMYVNHSLQEGFPEPSIQLGEVSNIVFSRAHKNPAHT